MKKITMDFVTYEKELAEARREGAELNTKVIEEIKNIFSGLNSYNHDEVQKAKYELNVILNRLTR